MENKIIIFLRGGLVTSVYSTTKAEVEIFDHSELESAPDDEIANLEKEWERGREEAKKMHELFSF